MEVPKDQTPQTLILIIKTVNLFLNLAYYFEYIYLHFLST